MKLKPHAIVSIVLLFTACVTFGQKNSVQKPDPASLTFFKWSGPVNVPDPVALSLDHQGRVYVTQTQRRKAQDLDIRQNRDWIPNDVGFESVDDKLKFYHDRLAPQYSDRNQGRVGDLNSDGSHDYRDLTVLSERIHRLEDTDRDGVADRSRVFADGFQTEVTGIAAGVLWHKGEVYATIAPDVWKLRDTDGDGRTDLREVIAHGFGLHIAYAGHDMHGLTVGPDGKIYWSIGDKGINVTTRDGRPFLYPNQGGVMRCNPDGSDFEVFAHGLRNVQELAFDEYGNLFGVDNDADLPGEKERFVYIVKDMDAGWRCNYQYRGGDYNPWMEEGLWKPYFEGQPAYIVPPITNYEDGPAGFVYNPGTALSPAYRNYFFMTEAPRGIQWAFTTRPQGASFEMVHSHRIGNGIPLVGLNFGPDGALYGVDWGGGYPLNQKGAVWKIDVPGEADSDIRRETQQLLRQGMNSRSTAELQNLLCHPDQRVRLEAQFELVEHNEWKRLAVTSKQGPEPARIHAIWGLGQLARQYQKQPVGALVSLLRDDSAEIRVQAARTLRDLPTGSFDPQPLVPLLSSRFPRVRFHAAMALAAHPLPSALEPVLKLIASNTEPDLYLRHAGIQALAGLHAGQQLLQHPSEEVRLSAVVALRLHKDPSVAAFLHDHSPQVAAEAARAVHDDFSIPEALPQLAEILSITSHTHQALIRRSINANFRLGQPHHLKAVAQYAARSEMPLELRLAAVDALNQWVFPPLLDRVDGRRRDHPRRPPEPLAQVLKGILPKLASSENQQMVEAAVNLASQYDIQLQPATLHQLLRNSQAPVSLRVVALNNLDSPEAVAFATAAEKAELRIAGARWLAQQKPSDAADYAASRLSQSDNVREQQNMLEILSKLENDKAVDAVRSWGRRLLDGTVPPALHLDLMEAMAAHGLDEMLSQFRKQRDDSPLAAYSDTLHGGNPHVGEQIFNTHITAQCVRCHTAQGGAGSAIGPSLEKVGEKSREYLLESMIQPNATITPGYGLLNVTLTNGESIGGHLMEETDSMLKIKLPDGELVEVAKDNISDQTPVISVMPPMAEILTRRELRDVMAYLSTLK